jgi:hypothetical protein
MIAIPSQDVILTGFELVFHFFKEVIDLLRSSFDYPKKVRAFIGHLLHLFPWNVSENPSCSDIWGAAIFVLIALYLNG